MGSIDLSSMQTRLRVVLTRDEQPNPASPLDENEIVDMLLLLAHKADEQDKRLKAIEEALRYGGML